MPLVRMLIAQQAPTSPGQDAIVNTLYFNVSGAVGQDPDYQKLVDDLFTIWAAKPWTGSQNIDIRAYNMDDAKPRPIRAQKKGPSTIQSGYPGGPAQVALCLSYYGDRNLPRQRGRIYIGPWDSPYARPSATQVQQLVTLAGQLSGLGGLNVDWSVYSPTSSEHHAIKAGWVDNSWDIIRSRQLSATTRTAYTANG